MKLQAKALIVTCSIVVLALTSCTRAEDEIPPSPTPAITDVEIPAAVPVPTVGPQEWPSEAGPSPTTVPAPTATPAVTLVPTDVPTQAVESIAPTPTIDPAVTVVMDMVARVNDEDYAGAAELFADDALIYLIGMPPTGMEIYRGREQFRTFLEECCSGQEFVWEVTPGRARHDQVAVEAQTWMNFTRELGVAPNSFHEIFVVEDGLITLYASTMTEETLARFRPALREAMPALFEAAPPFDETLATEVAITITDSSCAYDGPLNLLAGELAVNIDVEDQRWEKYAVSFFTLDADKDMVDLMASTHRAAPPPWSRVLFLTELKPDAGLIHNTLTIEEGLLYMVCWAGPPDMAIGNAGPFVVKS